MANIILTSLRLFESLNDTMPLNNPSQDPDAKYWQDAMDIALDPCSPMSDIVQHGQNVTYHHWSLEQIASSTIRTSVAIAMLCRDHNHQKIMDPDA